MASTNKKFYSDVQIKSDIIVDGATTSTVPVFDGSKKIKSSTVTSTELEHLSGVTSNVQSQITSAQSDATQALADSAAAQADATQALADSAAAQSDIDNHIAAVAGAHAASAISVTPSGNLAADDVQEALVELQGDADALDGRLDAIEPDVADLISLSGVAANSADLGTFTGAIIPDSSTIKGALQSLETSIESLPDPMEYKGNWDASLNSPALADGTGNNGDVYHVNAAGSVDFGSGSISFVIGDKVVYNGVTAKWEKWDLTDSVTSVFGRSGAVSAQSGDYSASQITNTPAGSIAATDVQAAINEIDGDVQAAQADATQALADAAAAQADINNHIADAADAHDASAISYDNVSSGLTATDVQAAIDEVVSAIGGVGSPGDIDETSFSFANNQVAAADVTGLAFANGVVRSFEALVLVLIDATTDSYEQFHLNGIQRSTDWAMTIESEGDDSGVLFTISNAGQVQYTSANSAGFVSGTMKFRAITTSI